MGDRVAIELEVERIGGVSLTLGGTSPASPVTGATMRQVADDVAETHARSSPPTTSRARRATPFRRA
jgi:hypothetical protein